MHQPLCVFILLACLAGPAAARCEARSGSQTAALVELYTAARCSGCPPAERWLSSLAGRPGVVALTLHVEYREYVGAEDNLVTRRLTPLQRMALVYTPQVLLQGRDFRNWRSRAFDEAVVRINASPARARLELRAAGATPQALEVMLEAELLEPVSHAALYLAAHENRRVLEWRGPLGFSKTQRISRQLSLPLLPGAAVDKSGVAAFVQDRGTGEVLQTLILPACFS